ncbi:hypothetical protein NE237_023347 [Protea cynaroides]|uniref:EF-hand domain-containing protein n=1 Tax=Protea cynaroides TaxID=273540 RepID=A0A9Q0K6J4_9MAGN|nr:hypothetical protein NE237_023347 [Protea cynaroides]
MSHEPFCSSCEITLNILCNLEQNMPFCHFSPVRTLSDISPSLIDELKQWWLTNADADGDGRISKEELRDFLKRQGYWFTSNRTGQFFKHNDFNHNGVIDDDRELTALVEFGLRNLKMKIVKM